MKRTLHLRKEVLTELAAAELEAVAGAGADSVFSMFITCPIKSCVSFCPTCETCVTFAC
jgi:hypothetical protein